MPRGFTLIELLVAISLFATAMAITFSTFYSITKAWQKGESMADDLNRGEYVMEQLVVGLRSAFFPVTQTKKSGNDYGFILEDMGSDSCSGDVISWVKTGAALLGVDNVLQRGLHRVSISIEDDEDGHSAIASRVWRPYANPDTFNFEDLKPLYLSTKITGFNCRVSTNRTEEGWEWESLWENEATNHLPLAVELTLYLEPVEKGGQPVEMKRLVEIPVAPLSLSGKTRGRPR